MPDILPVGSTLKDMAGASQYVIDFFPVAVCDNIRISRSKLLKGEQWRGKQCSMRPYFYNIKVQVLVNDSGIPVEFDFGPGRESDVQALKKLLCKFEFLAGCCPNAGNLLDRI